MGEPSQQDHHYVPRFLLRPWCTPEKSGAEKLWVCRRLPTGKLHHRRYAPRSTGYVPDLYKLQPSLVGVPQGPGEKPYAVEEKYSQLENDAAVIRDKFLAGTAPSELSPAERKVWAEFLATLEHRNPRQVRTAEAAGIAMREQLRQEHRERFGDPDYADEVFAQIDYEAVVKNAARTTVLVNRHRLAEAIAGWRWVCASHTGLDLITADYPIASLLHEGKCIASYLPLSPRMLFIAASAPIGRNEAAMALLSSNLLLIQQRPNFIYSREKLADGDVFRLLKAADDTVAEPEDL